MTTTSNFQSTAYHLLQIPIEQVPLGAPVPTKNPKTWEVDQSFAEPDEATWMVVSFTVERSDGGIVDAELLRPRSWVEQFGIEAGQLLPLNIEELQIEGYAFVNSVKPSPRIAAGEGSEDELGHSTWKEG